MISPLIRCWTLEIGSPLVDKKVEIGSGRYRIRICDLYDVNVAL